MKEVKNNEIKTGVNKCQDKNQQIKKQKQKAETQKFKSKYFDFYDDIKISDRQDW